MISQDVWEQASDDPAIQKAIVRDAYWKGVMTAAIVATIFFLLFVLYVLFSMSPFLSPPPQPFQFPLDSEA